MQLSKINKAILSLAQELNEYINEPHDFDTRDGYIVANIKMKDFLSESDISATINPLNLDEEGRRRVMDEFNANRLWSITSHCAQWEIECFKEDINDHETYENPNSDYQRFANAVNSLGVGSSDIWQFGRSGGWLSFIDENDINFDYNQNDGTYLATEIAYYYDEDMTNDQFNELLKSYIDINKNFQAQKKELIREMKDGLFELRATINHCHHVIKWIEVLKNDFIDYCRERLRCEIIEFINEEFNTLPNATILIKNNNVITSMGVSVSLNNAISLYKICKSAIHQSEASHVNVTQHELNEKIGQFRAEYVFLGPNNDWILKAGCHRIAFSHIDSVIASVQSLYLQ